MNVEIKFDVGEEVVFMSEYLPASGIVESIKWINTGKETNIKYNIEGNFFDIDERYLFKTKQELINSL